MRWFRKIAHAAMVDQSLVRATNRSGMGLMNNQALDRMKLSDEEEDELVHLMDLGLSQPRGVPTDAIFFFTEDGFRSHSRLVRLLRKASINGYVEHRIRYTGTPLWVSNDGQVAIRPEEVQE